MSNKKVDSKWDKMHMYSFIFSLGTVVQICKNFICYRLVYPRQKAIMHSIYCQISFCAFSFAQVNTWAILSIEPNFLSIWHCLKWKHSSVSLLAIQQNVNWKYCSFHKDCLFAPLWAHFLSCIDDTLHHSSYGYVLMSRVWNYSLPSSDSTYLRNLYHVHIVFFLGPRTQKGRRSL